jgi:hypothetical protein
MKQYDVIVVGGGPAGVPAAIAAARGGQKVLIIEASNALGGAINTMQVMPFMEYVTPIRGRENRVFLVRGIFEEICLRHNELVRELEGESRHVSLPLFTFSDEYMKIVLPRMVREAGVDVLYHAKMIGATCENNKVTSITVAAKSQIMTLTAKVFIDCTGDAELAYQAGFPTRLGRPVDSLCQPMTLCFRVGDIDVPTFIKNLPLIQKLYAEAKARGEITNPRENVLIFHTFSPNVIHFNTTRIVKHNPVDPFEISRAEEMVREQVYEMFKFLRNYAPGCEKATLLSTAAHIGVRESRMIDGEYVLTKEDLLANRKFEDGIAACNYDIDIHNPEGSGTSHYFFPDWQYYTIPYRSLVPKNSDNLLVAGRCISSDHDAQASYRVMPFVAALGHAAGVAAAVAIQNGTTVKDADVAEIQSTLRAQNAFIESEIEIPEN